MYLPVAMDEKRCIVSPLIRRHDALHPVWHWLMQFHYGTLQHRNSIFWGKKETWNKEHFLGNTFANWLGTVVTYTRAWSRGYPNILSLDFRRPWDRNSKPCVHQDEYDRQKTYQWSVGFPSSQHPTNPNADKASNRERNPWTSAIRKASNRVADFRLNSPLPYVSYFPPQAPFLPCSSSQCSLAYINSDSSESILSLRFFKRGRLGPPHTTLELEPFKRVAFLPSRNKMPDTNTITIMMLQ